MEIHGPEKDCDNCEKIRSQHKGVLVRNDNCLFKSKVPYDRMQEFNHLNLRLRMLNKQWANSLPLF